MTRAGVRWVVFDYGEVISQRTAALPRLAELLDTATTEFEAAYWAEREPYDRGCADLAYWRAVGSRLGVGVDDALSAALTETDVNGWLDTDPDTLALLADLDDAGVPLALLSNAPSSFGRTAERQEWTRHFKHLVFSGDLGIAKPDQEIWAALAGRLAARPAECLFLDDRQSNVDGARLAGLHAELWSGAPAIRRRLAELGVL